MKNENRLRVFSLSPMANCPCEFADKSKKLMNKLPSTGFFIVTQKWMGRSTGDGGFISPQNGNLLR